jgi:hypothetical protein
MALQNGSNTAGFIRLLHVLIADDVMWSLLVKDDILELASGEARASLGHSSSDLWMKLLLTTDEPCPRDCNSAWNLH